MKNKGKLARIKKEQAQQQKFSKPPKKKFNDPGPMPPKGTK